MTSRAQPRGLRRTAARRFDRIAALLLLAAGAGGFYHVVTTISPIAGPIAGGLPDAAYAQAFFASPNAGGLTWLLLALLVATVGGSWFVVRLLHWRFRPTFEPLKVWRQSLWVAVFVAIGAWLQLFRAFTFALAMLIAGAFALLEVFLNVRERRE